jgi:hypothetical protein
MMHDLLPAAGSGAIFAYADEHGAIHRSAPKIMQNAANADEYVIQVPRISRPRPTFAQASGDSVPNDSYSETR